jgi:hypothetical protein
MLQIKQRRLRREKTGIIQQTRDTNKDMYISLETILCYLSYTINVMPEDLTIPSKR